MATNQIGKPRLYKSCGRWFCILNEHHGIGKTPVDAYINWVSTPLCWEAGSLLTQAMFREEDLTLRLKNYQENYQDNKVQLISQFSIAENYGKNTI